MKHCNVGPVGHAFLRKYGVEYGREAHFEHGMLGVSTKGRGWGTRMDGTKVVQMDVFQPMH